MRKLIILSVMFFALINVSYAQLSGQAIIDSLKAELPKGKQDTNHVNLLADLSFKHYSFEPDKGIEYGEKGLALAKKLSWKVGEAKCYNSLGVVYSFGKSNYPKALEYYHKSLKIHEELGNKSGVAANLSNIGIIYSSQSDYPKALEYHLKALKINEELGRKPNIANNLNNIGGIYSSQSEYSKAIECFHKALKINEELENKSGIASNLGGIGTIYQNQSDYPKALEYYHKSLKINEELGNKQGIARNLGNIGELYFTLSQDTVLSKINEGTELVSLNKEINLNRSIEYFLESIELFEEIGELHKRSNLLKNLSNAYTEKGDYKKAFESNHTKNTKPCRIQYSLWIKKKKL